MAARGQLKKILRMQNSKLKVKNYSNFTITFPTIWRCAGAFCKVLLKCKMAATDQCQIFEGAKTQKISQKLFTFYNHIPHDMEMCR